MFSFVLFCSPRCAALCRAVPYELPTLQTDFPLEDSFSKDDLFAAGGEHLGGAVISVTSSAHLSTSHWTG
jgi:hypothetical protein